MTGVTGGSIGWNIVTWDKFLFSEDAHAESHRLVAESHEHLAPQRRKITAHWTKPRPTKAENERAEAAIDLPARSYVRDEDDPLRVIDLENDAQSSYSG